MAFSKSFPRTSDKSVYPRWEEVYLTEKEEIEEEKRAREKNLQIMRECIDDAKNIFSEKNLKPYQTDTIHVAIALFEKRASHQVFWKERKCKEKFDKQIASSD